jgi:transposase-like protein
MERYTISPALAAKDDQTAEIKRLKQELTRVTKERDILKSHRVFRQGCNPNADVNIGCRARNEIRIH